MSTSRRGFIAGASALVVLPGCSGSDEPSGPGPAPEPAPDRDPEPPAWGAPGTLDDVGFAYGVQIGDVTETGALVSVHTADPEVELIVVVADGDDWVEQDRQSGLVPVEGVVQLELIGLRADTAYRCVFVSTDGTRRSEITRFRTALGADGFRKVVFGATSCLGSNNPGFDSLARVAESDPDFFLLLGDTVYADGSVDLDDYRDEWHAAFAKPSVRAMFAATSVIATWDDHEVANNWTLGPGDAIRDTVSPEQLEDAIAAFREAIPQRQAPNGGLWRQVSWGAVLDVFVLDSRGERNDADRIVSPEQLEWVIEALQASTARFKIVLASVHMADHTELMGSVQDKDRWQGYPTQRTPLVEVIHEVPGAVVITGDMHYAGLQYLSAPGGTAAHVPEICAGPAGSEVFLVGVVAELADAPVEQYVEFIEVHCSCLCVADPGLGTLTVSFVADDGSVVSEHLLEL